MTESEAIELFKERLTLIKEHYAGEVKDYEEAIEIGIQALEKVQQYRAIGTMEELQAVMEKQIAKKPTYEGDGYAPDGTLVYDTWICPCCDKRYEVDYDDYDYCPSCGQKLDWSDEE